MSVSIVGKNYFSDTTRLILRCKGAKKLPDDIDVLHNLKKLDIFSNSIGYLPYRITNMVSLTELVLDNNNISNLPVNIGNLVNLTLFSMNQNNLNVLPDSIGRWTKLTYLSLNKNKLVVLPNSIGNLVKIRVLNVALNKLVCLPDTISNLTKLQRLDAYGNNGKEIKNKFEKLRPVTVSRYLGPRTTNSMIIPASIGKLVGLKRLNLSESGIRSLPDEFGQLVDMRRCNLSGNELRELPRTIGHLQRLNTLDISNNQIRHLPNEIINLGTCNVIRHGNPFDRLNTRVRTYFDNQKTIARLLYNDSQNVHDHNVQESIRLSIFNVINDECVYNIHEVISMITEDPILSYDTIGKIMTDVDNKTIFVSCQVTYAELLVPVWQRIIKHESSDEIKKIFDEEVQDGKSKCFTGRISRLVNCLCGFYKDVEIKIGTNQQIGNVILIIKDKLIRENKFSVKRWQKESRKELEERDHSETEIQEWLTFMEDYEDD